MTRRPPHSHEYGYEPHQDFLRHPPETRPAPSATGPDLPLHKAPDAEQRRPTTHRPFYDTTDRRFHRPFASPPAALRPRRAADTLEPATTLLAPPSTPCGLMRVNGDRTSAMLTACTQAR
ncbi:hypothetical protein GCM10020358_82880 [Amorphoplanes nipponensis]